MILDQIVKELSAVSGGLYVFLDVRILQDLDDRFCLLLKPLQLVYNLGTLPPQHCKKKKNYYPSYQIALPLAIPSWKYVWKNSIFSQNVVNFDLSPLLFNENLSIRVNPSDQIHLPSAEHSWPTLGLENIIFSQSSVTFDL